MHGLHVLQKYIDEHGKPMQVDWVVCLLAYLLAISFCFQRVWILRRPTSPAAPMDASYKREALRAHMRRPWPASPHPTPPHPTSPHISSHRVVLGSVNTATGSHCSVSSKLGRSLSGANENSRNLGVTRRRAVRLRRGPEDEMGWERRDWRRRYYKANSVNGARLSSLH